MRVLVTGAQGFLGSYAVAELAKERELDIITIGRSPRNDRRLTHRVSWRGVTIPAPRPADLCSSAQHSYFRIDVANYAALRRLFAQNPVDAIIHLASKLRGDDVEELFHCNVVGTVTLLRALADAGCRPFKVVLGSSGGVYGESAGRGAITETSSCSPMDHYAVSKLAAERCAAICSRDYGIPVVYARIFNVVGPAQDERHVCGRLAQQIASIAAGHSPPHITMGDTRPVRDFIDVRDAAAALRVLMHDGVPGAAYNVASGRKTRIGRLLEILSRQAGLPQVRIDRDSAVTSPVTVQTVDVAALRRLGFRPRYAIEQSLRDVVRYYLNDVQRAYYERASALFSATSSSGERERLSTMPFDKTSSSSSE